MPDFRKNALRVCLGLLPLTLLLMVTPFIKNPPLHFPEAETGYSLTVDGNNAPETLSVTPTSGYFVGPKDVEFEYKDVTEYGVGLLTLGATSIFGNYDQITSITSYRVVFSGDCRITFGFEYHQDIVSYAQGEYLQSGATYSIADDYYFFKLTANSGTVSITSVTIGYSCIPTPTAPEYTLAPDGLSYVVTGYTKQPTDLEIPNTYNGKPVTEIAASAFEFSFSLTGVYIPDSINKIGAYAFASCVNLTSVRLPAGLLTLSSNLFEGCVALETITLPETLTKIDEYAFMNSGLTSITIPSSVTEFGFGCFYFTQHLSSVLFEKPFHVTEFAPYQFAYSSLTSIVIPEGITSIGSSAFEGSALESVTFPTTLTHIEMYAFYQCTNFVTINGIISNVSYIGTGAFHESAWIDLQIPVNSMIIFDDRIVLDGQGASGDVIFPSTVTFIAPYAFASNEYITSITASSGLTAIGESAFDAAPNLTSVYLSLATNLTDIGAAAFADCDALTTIDIPTSVIDVGDRAFIETSWLNNQLGPNALIIINDRVVIDGTQTSGAITLPSTVTKISYAAFTGAGIESISLPSGLTHISYGAFQNCGNLTAITIPDSVTCLGQYAFAGSGLINVSLSTAITDIYENTFAGCSDLQSITLPSGLKTIGHGAFSDCISLTTISLPSGLTFIGLEAFASTSALTSIVIPGGVSHLYDRAFMLSGLETVTINEGLTSIGDSAFEDCATLTSIDLPDSLLAIGNYAFYGCEALSSIFIPMMVAWVGTDCFNDCLGLTINIAASSIPEFWASTWNPGNRPVIANSTR